jgi:hypothetical protein
MMLLETFRVRADSFWNFLCLRHAIAEPPERVREFARAIFFRSYCIGNLAKDIGSFSRLQRRVISLQTNHHCRSCVGSSVMLCEQ